MNRISFLLLSALVTAFLPAISQTEKGSWELSFTGNAGSYSQKSEYTSGGQTHTNEGEARSYAALDFRAGYFLVDGLSLEPEFYFLGVEKTLPTYNLGVNVAYTFTIPESPVRPFLIAGYGTGNGIPMMQRLLARESENLDIPVLRVGGGLKVLLNRWVALKVEYRYERYTDEQSTQYYSSKTVSNYGNILFGFSFFLPARGS